MLKKSINAFLTATLVAGLVLGAGAPTADAKKAPKAPKTEQVQKADKSKQSVPAELPYTYTSRDYGYTIQCPQRPLGTIPANIFYGDDSKKGEILVFANEGYNVIYGWAVLQDAFTDRTIPDLNQLNDEHAKALVKHMMNTYGYEGAMIVELANHNKAIYAVTGKVLDVDTDGDGQPDQTVEASSQNAVTYFRGADGVRYCVTLIDNPELRDEAIDLYQKALNTFKTSKG